MLNLHPNDQIKTLKGSIQEGSMEEVLHCGQPYNKGAHFSKIKSSTTQVSLAYTTECFDDAAKSIPKDLMVAKSTSSA